MSIVICDHCDRWIDSDYDAECFIENPYNNRDTTILCEPCREAAWEREQERLMEEGPGHSLLEQQAAALRFK